MSGTVTESFNVSNNTELGPMQQLAFEPVTEHGMPFINFRQKHNRAKDDQSGDKSRRVA